MIVVGGSCDADQEAMGGFQEYPQVSEQHTFLVLFLFSYQWFFF